MKPLAIKAEEVTVEFRPFVERKPTLRKTLANFRSRQRESVTALDQSPSMSGRGRHSGSSGATAPARAP